MKKFITFLIIAFCSLNYAQQHSSQAKFEKNEPKIVNGKIVFENQSTNENMPTQILGQIWIPDNWEDDNRVIMSYNNSGFLSQQTIETIVDGVWILESKMVVEYTGNDVAKMEMYFYDDGIIDYGRKFEYQTSDGIITEVIYYDLDTDTSEWIKDQKEVYEYSGQLNTRIAVYNWNDFANNWDVDGEILFTYDNLNREIEKLEKDWSANDNQYQNAYITTTEYYINGEMSSQLYKAWDVDNNQWADSNYTLVEWEYDENVNCIVYTTTSMFSIMGFSIVTKIKNEYEYDTNNYLIKDTYYTWEDFAEEWIIVNSSEYTNNAEGEVQEILVLIYDGFGGWSNFEKYIYSYNGTVDVETDKILVDEFLLMQNYPNPFNPSTKISFTLSESNHVKLKVYDILGNYINTLIDEFKNSGSYEIRFNAFELASGTYVYTLQQGKNILSKKCILLK
ncbi:MAG: T9SS type A sorting domain-containing protein [Ignavibacteriales bacterium]|nr:T9SS type A sorting domain-containing protein [Ignavibacteriales bacterium]MCB9257736.1 T9SS type A sorting domain-containing protein [Ignavibacteriales bacterium]